MPGGAVKVIICEKMKHDYISKFFRQRFLLASFALFAFFAFFSPSFAQQSRKAEVIRLGQEFDLKMRAKSRHQHVHDEVARAIDAALSVGILDAHTARRVDENRYQHIVHPIVAPTDRTQQEEHQQREGDEA